MKKRVRAAFFACLGLLLLAAGLVAFWVFGSARPTVVIGDIQLDRSEIEMRIKEDIIAGREVNFDDIVLELTKEQCILNELKGTPQEITEKDYAEMRQSAQESYYKSKEENEIFIKKYNMSKEECVEMLFSMEIRSAVERRYLQLVQDELFSEYAQKYGEDQPVDPQEIPQMVEQRIDELAADLPSPVYNKREIKTMNAAIEAWEKTIDDSITLS